MIRKKVLGVGTHTATLLVEDTQDKDSSDGCAEPSLKVLRRVNTKKWSTAAAAEAETLYRKVCDANLGAFIHIYQVLAQNSFLNVIGFYCDGGDLATFIEEAEEEEENEGAAALGSEGGRRGIFNEKQILVILWFTAAAAELLHRGAGCNFYGLGLDRLFFCSRPPVPIAGGDGDANNNNNGAGGNSYRRQEESAGVTLCPGRLRCGLPLPPALYFSRMRERKRDGVLLDVEYPPEVIERNAAFLRAEPAPGDDLIDVAPGGGGSFYYDSEKSDVWHLGLVGRKLSSVFHTTFRKTAGRGLREAVERMLSPSPDARPTLREARKQLERILAEDYRMPIGKNSSSRFGGAFQMPPPLTALLLPGKARAAAARRAASKDAKKSHEATAPSAPPPPSDDEGSDAIPATAVAAARSLEFRSGGGGGAGGTYYDPEVLDQLKRENAAKEAAASGANSRKGAAAPEAAGGSGQRNARSRSRGKASEHDDAKSGGRGRASPAPAVAAGGGKNRVAARSPLRGRRGAPGDGAGAAAPSSGRGNKAGGKKGGEEGEDGQWVQQRLEQLDSLQRLNSLNEALAGDERVRSRHGSRHGSPRHSFSPPASPRTSGGGTTTTGASSPAGAASPRHPARTRERMTPVRSRTPPVTGSGRQVLQRSASSGAAGRGSNANNNNYIRIPSNRAGGGATASTTDTSVSSTGAPAAAPGGGTYNSGNSQRIRELMSQRNEKLARREIIEEKRRKFQEEKARANQALRESAAASPVGSPRGAGGAPLRRFQSTNSSNRHLTGGTFSAGSGLNMDNNKLRNWNVHELYGGDSNVEVTEGDGLVIVAPRVNRDAPPAERVVDYKGRRGAAGEHARGSAGDSATATDDDDFHVHDARGNNNNNNSRNRSTRAPNAATAGGSGLSAWSGGGGGDEAPPPTAPSHVHDGRRQGSGGSPSPPRAGYTRPTLGAAAAASSSSASSPRPAAALAGPQPRPAPAPSQQQQRHSSSAEGVSTTALVVEDTIEGLRSALRHLLPFANREQYGAILENIEEFIADNTWEERINYQILNGFMRVRIHDLCCGGNEKLYERISPLVMQLITLGGIAKSEQEKA